MNLPIIHENSHWLAINKPAGIIVEENPWEHSIQGFVLAYLSKSIKTPFLGIVHRLDRVTSGALILAKKKSALKKLNEQFRLRKVRKTYLAILESGSLEEKGNLSHWLQKDQKNKKARVFSKKVENAFKVHLSYKVLAKNSEFLVLEIKPQTGKFHQIRAQLSAIGHPILGDEKYGSEKKYSKNSIALHAWKLSFNDPVTDTIVEIKAPLPDNAYWNAPDL